jgi:predicted  nucleic acid-binding Zn-ribbon protein
MMPGSTPQWSYKFPTGKTIFLSSPCTKCGGKHFNFECKKPRPGAARAAFILPEDSWDEFTTDTADETEEEDELAVAYMAYPGYESDPAQADAYRTPTNRMQITDQPWDEMAMKKEN